MRFGIAQVDITPPFRVRMAGYGGRHDLNDDVHDPLTFTAVVLEERGRRACLGAADLLWFDNDHVMELRKEIAKTTGAPIDNVMLNASHTHGGPLVADHPHYLPDKVDTSTAAPYRKHLARQVLAAARKAAKSLQPGSLWLGQGTTSVPMNRRPDRKGDVPLAPNPDGPKDDRLQVLVLRDKDEAIRAVLARVSCHPVSTGAQHRITADYPGAFRAAFARTFGPEVVPVFLQGAGADTRPSRVCDGDKWRVMPHAELMDVGTDLLHETLAVLTSNKLQKVGPLTLRGRLNVADVPCEPRLTSREQLEAALESGASAERTQARNAIGRLEAEGRVPTEIPVRVHTLWLAADTALIGVQGETLCGLGAHVEKALAPARTLFLGYTNGAVGYLPDSKELARGGYEASSYVYRGWSGPFKKGIEKVIAAAAWKRK